MRALLLLLTALLWVAVIEGGLRVWEADDARRSWLLGECLARTYKTVQQCEEAP